MTGNKKAAPPLAKRLSRFSTVSDLYRSLGDSSRLSLYSLSILQCLVEGFNNGSLQSRTELSVDGMYNITVGIIGAVLILGSTLISGLPEKTE